MKMSIADAIIVGVHENDLGMLASVVDQCRGLRWTYDQTAEAFRKCAGVDRGEFETLMQRIDAGEVGG